mgnify:CR=1 FL=1
MICTRRPPDASLSLSTTGGERAPGLHLSDIVKRMQWERDQKYKPDSAPDMMTLEYGHTWERVLENALRERHQEANIPYRGHRPDAIQVDGIWMSPDWLNPGAEFAAEEWKATKVSSKTPFQERQWYWLPQIMGYLHGLRTTKQIAAYKCLLRVWYINGDYTYESKSSDLTLLRDYHEYELSFTPREIQENWRSLVSHAIKYGLLPAAPQEQETTWQKRSSQTETPRKSSKPAPPPSRPAPKLATSLSSKTTKSRRSGS